MPRLRQGRRRRCPVGVQHGQRTLDLGIALVDARLVEVVQGQRLRQREDVLGLIVAHQRCADRLRARLAANIAHGRQHLWVSLTVDDGTDDLQASHPSDVADHMVQLQVHEGQCLLHVLDVGGAILEMALAQAQISPQGGDVASGAEARAQQAARVQALQPLRIVDVALAPGYGSGFAGVGNDDFYAAILQHFVHRHPVHPSGFQRHRLDTH